MSPICRNGHKKTTPNCKICVSDRNRRYKMKNPEKVRSYNRRWFKTEKGKALRHRVYMTRYTDEYIMEQINKRLLRFLITRQNRNKYKKLYRQKIGWYQDKVYKYGEYAEAQNLSLLLKSFLQGDKDEEVKRREFKARVMVNLRTAKGKQARS